MRPNCYLLFLVLVISQLGLGRRLAAAPKPASPAEFIQNRGQWPAPVRFAANLQAGRLFLENDALTYVLAAPELAGPTPAAPHGGAGLAPAQAYAYRVQFAGAAGAEVVGQQPGAVSYSYFQGADVARWVSQAGSFGRVQYGGLYPGIDLAVHASPEAQLEYTFTVQPGGQPAAICLRYAGPTSLRLDEAGRLQLLLPIGAVTELAPVAWQTDPATGQHQSVACAFRLAGQEVRFEVGPYDLARPLIIDPVVVFATFTGSQADNWGHTATSDAQGNFYSAGTVFSYGYPTSPGAYDPSFNGSVDVAIIKYNPRATGAAARVWATYLGGGQTDAPHRLVVSAQGEVLVLGSTASADFPTTSGAFDRQFHGGPAISPDGIPFAKGTDLFVARLAASGDQLLASTYLGGRDTDGFAALPALLNSPILTPRPSTGYGFSGGLQVDAAGAVYVAATTASPDFAAGSAGGSAFGGGASDAVVVKLAADLRTVRWRQLVGGSGSDAAYDLVLSADGSAAYACGGTNSPSFRPTPGAYTPPATGETDGFVVRLGTADGHVAAACRLGTDQADQALLLGLDAGGSVVVAGLSSGQVAFTPGHYGLPGTCFLAQLSAGLDQLTYSTTLGDYANSGTLLAPVALGLDACDQVYLALAGYTNTFPVSPGTLSPNGNTFYAVRLSSGARSLDYATRLPGDHAHGCSRFDANGRLYLAGCGNCNRTTAFAVPPGVNTYSAQSNAPAGRCNDTSLLADLSAAATGLAPPLAAIVCVGAGPLPLGGSPAGGTWTGPGVTGSAPAGYFFTPTPALVGTQVLTYQPPAGSAACAGVLCQQITVTLPTAVTFAPLPGPYCPAGQPLGVPLTAQPAGGYFSGPGVRGGTTSGAYFAAGDVGPGTYTLTYTLPGTDGRCGAASQTVVVGGTRVVVANPDTTLCGAPFQAFQLRAQPVGGTWSGPGVSDTGWFDPALLPATTTATNLRYTYLGPDNCPSFGYTHIRKLPQPAPNQLLTLPTCTLVPGLSGYVPFVLKLPLPTEPGGFYSISYNWDFGDGTGNLTTNNTSRPDTTHTYT